MRQSTLRFAAHDVAIRSWSPAEPAANPLKLLCFPFSGGGSTAFKPLAAALGPTWQVHAVNPPGHGLGAQLEPFDDVPKLVEHYLDCLPDDLLRDCVLLGYSLGGYVAHHMLLQLQARGRPLPRALVMCAVPPYERRARTYSDMSDDELFDGLTRLGGIPKGLGDARSAFSMFAHVVRADFRAYERCPLPDAQLDLPTLVIAGREDPIYRPEWLSEWTAFFKAPEGRSVPGPHIFVTEHSAELAAELSAWRRTLPPTRGPDMPPPHTT